MYAINVPCFKQNGLSDVSACTAARYLVQVRFRVRSRRCTTAAQPVLDLLRPGCVCTLTMEAQQPAKSYSEGQLNQFSRLIRVAARFLFAGDLSERLQEIEALSTEAGPTPAAAQPRPKRKRVRVDLSTELQLVHGVLCRRQYGGHHGHVSFTIQTALAACCAERWSCIHLVILREPL